MGLGAGELILILVIAYVVVGPQDMGKLARTLGKAVRQFKKFSADLREEAGGGLDLPSIQDLTVDLTQTGRPASNPADRKGAEALKKDAKEPAQTDLDSVLREITNLEQTVGKTVEKTVEETVKKNC